MFDVYFICLDFFCHTFLHVPNMFSYHANISFQVLHIGFRGRIHLTHFFISNRMNRKGYFINSTFDVCLLEHSYFFEHNFSSYYYEVNQNVRSNWENQSTSTIKWEVNRSHQLFVCHLMSKIYNTFKAFQTSLAFVHVFHVF